MAKKKKGQLAFRLGINDERIPKLLGILCLFIAFYLFVAFTSYLFTWGYDQDKLDIFFTELLSSDIEMANWLGKLGAVVSHAFFFWGFGIASFAFVYLFYKFGLFLIRKQKLILFVPLLVRVLIVMLIVSIFLGFVAGTAAFPFAGAFGQGISNWLHGFLGTVGMIGLFLMAGIGLVVWKFNPNFSEMTPQTAASDAQEYFRNLLNRRRIVKKPPVSGSLSSGSSNGQEEKTAVLTPNVPKTDLDPGQLSFNLNDANKPERPQSLQPGDSELEISAPVPKAQGEEEPGPAADARDVMPVTVENPDSSEPYDPTLDLSSYEFPHLQLLNDYSDEKFEVDRAELESKKDQIVETLLHYKIEIVKIRATIGPTVTLYEIVPAPGVRISKIKNLEDDIALSLSALGIRIIAPIPGKGTIGIEVPNKKKQTVAMKEILISDKFKRAKMDLPIALGKTISNEEFVADLTKMPHLLVAGATGQGKSVGINSILISILYKKHPSQVKLVLIDPKKVELFQYAALEKHFLAFLPDQEEPIITETTKVINTLNSLCIEMDTRYDLLKKAGARNIKEYNEKFVQRQLNPLKGHRFLPFIVLVIDEFADLIMTAGKEIELPIGRLAQLSRAVGIHLVIATQRPSVNIITGVIKANFPARIAYRVTAKVDSRTILDAGGADQLVGRGDMLLSVGGEMVRLQGAFVDTPEVEKVVNFIANQQGFAEPFFLPEFHGDDEGVSGAGDLKYADLDDMFEDAARLIVQQQHGSTSMIQRRLKLGYNRAGRIMDQLEAMGIVGPSEGSKAREVLIFDEIELERYLQEIRNKR